MLDMSYYIIPNQYQHIYTIYIDFFEKSGFEFQAAIFERNRLFSRIYSRGAYFFSRKLNFKVGKTGLWYKKGHTDIVPEHTW